MDFGSLGEKKKAIFCLIPVDDSSMNYLVGMLYTQCFQALYRRADEKPNGRLPVPVRVIQDEWANVAQPESYPKILATCRSYNIGLNIIVQNIQQIKALYEKEWESIIGNCDTLLFLGGGNEPTSLEFIVKLLGKETIATRTRGQTKGHSGSSSTNFQQTGRDLMTIDEVRKLDTHKAILFIRGEDPVLDKKYNIKRHPNIPLWLVTLLGSLFITVLAFIMILTVYGRFFKIYMYAALSPVALASFAGEGTSHFGKAFLRSYVGVCMEGAVIVLACIIFSAFSSSGTPVVDSSASVVTQVWSYLGEVIFNLLVLVGLVKSADHIAKEMLGL